MSDGAELDSGDEARERGRRARREYRARNAEKLKAYAAGYRAEHREEIRAKGREYMRGYNERKRAEAEQRAQRREYARAYYAKNREAYLEKQRALRQKRRAEDPDRYRELARNRNKRWRDTHKETENTKLRGKYRQKGTAEAERKRAYYQANKERITTLKRQRYAETQEDKRAYAHRYRAGERRRQEVGLPPRRLHRPDPNLVAVHEAEADTFFARRYSRADLERLRAEPPIPTPPELIARWERDSFRARAAAYPQTATALSDRLRTSEERRLAGTAANPEQAQAKAAEDARLDALAKAINDRLRTQPRTTPRTPEPHPAPIVPPRTSRGAGL